jgi:hypothetical protein
VQHQHSLANIACLSDATYAPCWLAYKQVDAGALHNIATVSAVSPKGVTVTAEDSDSQQFSPKVTMTVTATGTFEDDIGHSDNLAQVGEHIKWGVVIHNDGATTLNNITLTDPTLTALHVPLECRLGASVVTFDNYFTLAPGQSVVCDSLQPITQALINYGSATNTATATAKGPKQQDVTPPPVLTTVQLPVLKQATMKKTGKYVNDDENPYVSLGDHVDFEIALQNTGQTLYI